jgi:hypothetical protein
MIRMTDAAGKCPVVPAAGQVDILTLSCVAVMTHCRTIAGVVVQPGGEYSFFGYLSWLKTRKKGKQEVVVGCACGLYLQIAKLRSLPIGRTSGHAATSRRVLDIDALQGIAVPLL